MITQHTPSLSSIVDQLTVRIEDLADAGTPEEAAALRHAREVLVTCALPPPPRARPFRSALARVLSHFSFFDRL